MATMTKDVKIEMEELVEYAKAALEPLRTKIGNRQPEDFDPMAFRVWLCSERKINVSLDECLYLFARLVSDGVLGVTHWRAAAGDITIPTLRFHFRSPHGRPT